jgi:GT2 family glycosyltransferase
MRLSLVVCTFCRPKAVARLTKALEDVLHGPDEIVIVDSSPDERTEEALKACKLPLRYYRVGEEHRGLTRQRNFGAAISTGEIIAFFDDDIVPDQRFFVELRSCWGRHPEAVGIGGYIVGEEWKRRTGATEGRAWFVWNDMARREPLRWVARKWLCLASDLPPGYVPPEGHGRSIGCYPPDGNDYQVEFLMGGVSSWRSDAARQVGFSTFFEGYGLYEDMDFCLRAGKLGRLYLCTRAQVQHLHDPVGRPKWFRYGMMVVRNGWYVWRRRWPQPALRARVKWWLTTWLLIVIRATNGRDGFLESLGRVAGAVWVITNPPKLRPVFEGRSDDAGGDLSRGAPAA